MAAATSSAAARSRGWKVAGRARTIIVVEFSDVERARTWYRSPEYAEALAVRDEALGRNLILVDGISAT